jgi:hypothetical protein
MFHGAMGAAMARMMQRHRIGRPVRDGTPDRMRMPIPLAILLAAPGLSGADAWAQAARQDPPAIVRQLPAADWRGQASPRDRERLDTLPAVWAEALESVRAGGQAPAVTAAGPLLDSRGGRDGPPPGAGQYR